MATYRYTLAQRLLHWLIAVFVFGLLAIGFTLWTLGYDGTVQTFGNEVTDALYKYHKTFGILVLLLMLARVALRRARPAPPYDPPMSGLERFVGGAVHILFYALLIGMPIGGWIATAAGGYPIQFFDFELPGLVGKDPELSALVFTLHGIGGLVIAALLILHIGAAVKHWRLKDNVMERISLP